jgi:hypothetical protein
MRVRGTRIWRMIWKKASSSRECFVVVQRILAYLEFVGRISGGFLRNLHGLDENLEDGTSHQFLSTELTKAANFFGCCRESRK